MHHRKTPVCLALASATLALSIALPALAQDAPKVGGFGAIPAPDGTRNSDAPFPPAAPPRGRGMDGLRPGETEEQRTKRLLDPYIEAIPDLSEAQKTHLMVILDCISAEATAIGANTSLSPERRNAVGRALRASTSTRILSALTEKQANQYQASLAERQAAVAEMSKMGTARPDEDFEKMRARVLAGYEDVLEELSVKQKSAIIRILESAGEERAAVDADTAKNPAQKSAALLAIHNSIDAKVAPLLDAEQLQAWKKAHNAKRPQ